MARYLDLASIESSCSIVQIKHNLLGWVACLVSRVGIRLLCLAVGKGWCRLKAAQCSLLCRNSRALDILVVGNTFELRYLAVAGFVRGCVHVLSYR
jgi:hypothetical protein